MKQTAGQRISTQLVEFQGAVAGSGKWCGAGVGNQDMTVFSDHAEGQLFQQVMSEDLSQ